MLDPHVSDAEVGPAVLPLQLWSQKYVTLLPLDHELPPLMELLEQRHTPVDANARYW